MKLKRLRKYEYAQLGSWYIKSAICKRFLWLNKNLKNLKSDSQENFKKVFFEKISLFVCLVFKIENK